MQKKRPPGPIIPAATSDWKNLNSEPVAKGQLLKADEIVNRLGKQEMALFYEIMTKSKKLEVGELAHL